MPSNTRLLLLLAVSAVGTLLIASCGSPGPYRGHSPWLEDWEAKTEGENYVFKGRVVDAETGRPIPGAVAKLELIRVTGPAGEIFDLFGIDSWDYFNIWADCGVVDSIGSTGAYPKVNAFYRRHDLEPFIFERRWTPTDSLGLFKLRSTKRGYSGPAEEPEGYFQRIVVKEEGYRLFSQGVLSECEGHLQALRPVELVPKPDSTSGGTEPQHGRSAQMDSSG